MDFEYTKWQLGVIREQVKRPEVNDPHIGIILIKPQETQKKTFEIQTFVLNFLSEIGVDPIAIISKTLTPQEVFKINKEVFNAEALCSNQDTESEHFRQELIQYMCSGVSLALIVRGYQAKEVSLSVKKQLRDILEFNFGIRSEHNYDYAEHICNYIHVPELDEFEGNIDVFMEGYHHGE